jgi:hypothetical protein
MKGRSIFLLGLLLSAAISSCKSTSPSPAFPVIGSGSARAQLTGRWEGEYRSAATGRRGTIVIEFGRGDVAHGDVLMMPEGSSESLHPAHPEGVDQTLGKMQVLKIRFIETSEGALTGVLEPYVDPGCLCEVQTSFNGVIRGDRIEGSFTSKPVVSGPPETTGEWSVQRR